MYTSGFGLDESAVEETASVMLLLSHPGRLKLMLAIQHAPHSTRGQLAEDIQLDPRQVTHLLRNLRESGLIHRRKTGRSAHYSIADPAVGVLLDTLRDLAGREHALSA